MKILASVFQCGSKVRCDVAEKRYDKKADSVSTVASNWEVKFDPSKGPLLADIARIAGERVNGKPTLNFAKYSPDASPDVITLLFVILDGSEQVLPTMSGSKTTK